MKLSYLITAGFLKGYRTEVLGFLLFFEGFVLWIFGGSFIEQYPSIISGLALMTLKAAINDIKQDYKPSLIDMLKNRLEDFVERKYGFKKGNS